MLTIEHAAVTLGLTPRQVYRRVALARPMLSPYIRKGEKGKLLLDPGAIEVLRRAEEFRKEGVSIREALAMIRDEMSGNERGNLGQADGDLAETWKLLLAEKDKRIKALEDEVAFLRRRVEELTPLALPRSRPRLLAWLWPARRVKSAP